MKRKIYNELINWKNTELGRTALLIDGARRVGKSYIAEEFAKNEYKNYINQFWCIHSFGNVLKRPFSQIWTDADIPLLSLIEKDIFGNNDKLKTINCKKIGRAHV